MTMYTEGLHTAEFLLDDEDSYSREQVTLAAAAADLAPGTLLGKITASGKYAPYVNTNSDGTETAVAILYAHAPDLAVDQKVTIVARQAEVASYALVGLDAPARVDLAAVGIIVRD
jgi:hypothetical protein